jgi:hypothetical protein
VIPLSVTGCTHEVGPAARSRAAAQARTTANASALQAGAAHAGDSTMHETYTIANGRVTGHSAVCAIKRIQSHSCVAPNLANAHAASNSASEHRLPAGCRLWIATPTAEDIRKCHVILMLQMWSACNAAKKGCWTQTHLVTISPDAHLTEVTKVWQ